MFLADGFTAWLAAILADSGRKKLAHLFTGTDEQGRALRSIATAAIKATAAELSPEDSARAEFLATVIDEVFTTPTGEEPGDAEATAAEALEAAVGTQLAVLDDANRTGVNRSAADELDISTAELTEKLYGHLARQISSAGSRGGPLEPLANALGHEATHSGLRATQSDIRRLITVVEEGFARQAAAVTATVLPPAAPTAALPAAARTADLALRIEQLLIGLNLDDHDEAEHRIGQLFLPLDRADQKVFVDALLQEATSTPDHTTLLLASNLIQAADRLDPTLIEVEQVEALAASQDRSVRSCAAELLWQWAQHQPGRVPVPLLSRLAMPSQEDWYVHAPARAGACTLLLHRAAARQVFDRMVASRDEEDRTRAASDLLNVAKVEPRAVPKDLANALARDRDPKIAARGRELLAALEHLEERARFDYYFPFGM